MLSHEEKINKMVGITYVNLENSQIRGAIYGKLLDSYIRNQCKKTPLIKHNLIIVLFFDILQCY